MAAIVALDDFEKRLGVLLSGAERDRALAALEDASAIVRGATGKTYAGSVPEGVAAVTHRVARRLFLNPDGFSMESLGAASQQRPQADAGALLTPAEERMLKAVLGRGFVPHTVHTPMSHEGGGDGL